MTATVPQPVLDVVDLQAGFGSQLVLHGVSLSVRSGEISGVFGLNGAGKSVTLKTIAGLIPARAGMVRFHGRDVTGTSPERRVLDGMCHVPQGRQVFPAFTVEQNLRLGAYRVRRRDRARYRSLLDGVYDRFPILAERRSQLAGTMSGGQQASLAVARALMGDPSLILVDEPTAGLAPSVVGELFDTLRTVNDSGVSMLLVEQNVTFGLRLVDQAFILQRGQVVYGGGVHELDPDRVADYLGVGRLLATGVGQAIDARVHAARSAE